MMGWRRRLYFAGFLLGGLLFVQQLGQVYQAAVTQVVHSVAYGWLVVALLSVMAGTMLQVAAWVYLMGGLGVPLLWRKVVWGYIFSFVPRYVPGSVWGYLSRGEWLFQSQGVSRRVTALGSVLEVLGSACSVCMFAAFEIAVHYLDPSLAGLVIILVALAPFASWWLLNHLRGRITA